MAKIEKYDTLRLVSLSRTEAVELIADLASQLGDAPLKGRQAGGVEGVKIVQDGVVKETLILSVDLKG